MKKIFLIFASDMKNIAKNWVAIIIIGGLILIPSLYAWINILASTDPYGHTQGIKVAVVNLDQGGALLGNHVDIGKEVIENLKKNKKLGWTFYQSKEKAIQDTKVGAVYAAIVIPEDFSEKLCTMLDQPVKPTLEYYVNMKKNAIAPKMTEAGAKALQSQIKESFIDTVVKRLYQELNEIGLGLGQNYDAIENFKYFLYGIQEVLPKVQGNINDVIDFSKEGIQTIDEKKQDIVRIQNLLGDASKVTGSLSGDLNDVRNKIKDKEPELLNILNNTTTISEEVRNGSAKLLDIKKKIDLILDKLILYNQLMDHLKELTGSNYERNKLLNQVNQLSGEIASLTKEVAADLKDETLPKVYEYLSKGSEIADEANWAVNYGLEESEKLIGIANEVQRIGKEFIPVAERVSQTWPEYEKNLNNFINKVRKIDGEIDLRYLIRLMSENANQEGEFFASPVNLNTHELFPIKNYGAAMTPFYTTLCLWVGALVLTALLTTQAKNVTFPFTLKQQFFGKWMLFVFLGMLQGVVVALGDIFLLRIPVEHPFIFLLLAMFYSLVFVTIVYTFVAQLGNVGKAIGVILLVIQVAGSGGTFPIEVTPQYFQNIYATLPFTYAIDGMREALAGIVPENLRKCVFVLLGFFIAFILLGLVSKHWITRVTAKVNHKLSESGITEH